MGASTVPIEPPPNTRQAGFVIATCAIPTRIGIWRGRASLFAESTQNQLGIEVVAFLICMTNDFAERGAILLRNLKGFLRIELVALRCAKDATAGLAFDFDPAGD